MTCGPSRIIPFIVITVPMFVLELLAFLWIKKLKTLHSTDCACAVNWRQTFLYGYLGLVVVWTVALNMYRFSSGCQISGVSLLKSPIYVSFMTVLMIASFAFIVISLQYLSLLKKNKCECAMKSNGDDILRAVAYIKIISASLLILVMGVTLYFFLFKLLKP